MARRSEELVTEIRAQRQRLGAEFEALFSLDQVRDQVRSEPTAWLLGGVVTGALASRFLMPMAFGLASGWLKGKAKDTVMDLLVGAIRGRAPRGEADEAETVAAAFSARSARD